MKNIKNILNLIEKTEDTYLIKLSSIKNFIRDQESSLRFWKPKFDVGEKVWIIKEIIQNDNSKIFKTVPIKINTIYTNNIISKEFKKSNCVYEYYDEIEKTFLKLSEDKIFKYEEIANFQCSVSQWKYDNNIL